MNGTISVDLRNADVMDVRADALAIQYPQRLYGVIERAQRAFAQAHRAVLLPAPDATRLLEGVPGIAAPRILIVGVAPLHRYDYRDIHSFAKRAVLLLASVSGVHHIVMPVYGPDYGLDESKSFESQLSGLFDAIRGTKLSDVIRTITLAERDAPRAQRLNELFSLEQFKKARSAALEATQPTAERAEGLPEASSPVEHTASSRVFLCYRREDTQDAAGRLYDRLSDVYGPDRVFMDIDSIPLGVDFIEHVKLQISKCSAVIVMIGRQWLRISDQRHRRRLDNQEDR